MANVSSDHHPNHVPGMLTIIKAKHPNLPICSATATILLFHLFSKPSLYLIAKIIFGIIITAIIISPNIFSAFIYLSTTPYLLLSPNLPCTHSLSSQDNLPLKSSYPKCFTTSHSPFSCLNTISGSPIPLKVLFFTIEYIAISSKYSASPICIFLSKE